jgi:hypothetical protein
MQNYPAFTLDDGLVDCGVPALPLPELLGMMNAMASSLAIVMFLLLWLMLRCCR